MFSDEDLIQKLQKFCPFAALTEKEISIYLNYLEQVCYPKNTTIAKIGEIHESMYIVISGRTALYQDQGQESLEIGSSGEGDLVGEMSFFDRIPRQVRLAAVSENTCLLRLSRARYDRMRVEHPYFVVNLLECAITSLDHLFRKLSSDVATYSNYLYSPGKK